MEWAGARPGSGLLADLVTNLRAGLRLARGRQALPGAFRRNPDQALLLVSLVVALVVTLDLARTGSGALLSEFGVGRLAVLLLF